MDALRQDVRDARRTKRTSYRCYHTQPLSPPPAAVCAHPPINLTTASASATTDCFVVYIAQEEFQQRLTALLRNDGLMAEGRRYSPLERSREAQAFVRKHE